MKGEFQLRLKYKGHGEVIEFGRSHQLELYNCHSNARATMSHGVFIITKEVVLSTGS
jgi:hypothetical protein